MTLTTGQTALFILRAVWCFALPVAVLLWLHKRHDGRVYPAFVGVAAMLLLMLPRGLVRSLLVPQAEGFAAQFLLSDLIGACFEECGRFLAMQYMLRSYDRFPDALSYGLGHGGAEAFATGFSQIGLLMKALDGTAGEAVCTQGLPDAADIFAGEAVGIVFHMMLSVLVLLSVHRAGCRKYLPMAIGLHVCANIARYWFGTIADCIFTAGICYLTYRLYQKSATWGDDDG